MQTPEPGIYKDVSFPDYLSWDACSHSKLENIRRSEAYCKYRMDTPRVETDAMKLGTAFHVAILEPANFTQSYILRPEGNAAKLEKNGGCKEAYDEAKATGKVLLKGEEFTGCIEVADLIAQHSEFGPVLTAALAAGTTELSCVADVDHVRVKVRFDCYDESTGTVLDIKKTVDATTPGFPREISKYGHHRQAALYQAVLKALNLPVGPWWWAAIQSTPPWEMNPLQCSEEALNLGHAQNEVLIRRYIHAVTNGSWPGFENNIKSVGVAPWETDDEDDFELEDQG